MLKETVSSAEVLMASEVKLPFILFPTWYSKHQCYYKVLKLIVAGYMTSVDREPSDAQGRGAGKLLWLVANSSQMLVRTLTL